MGLLIASVGLIIVGTWAAGLMLSRASAKGQTLGGYLADVPTWTPPDNVEVWCGGAEIVVTVDDPYDHKVRRVHITREPSNLWIETTERTTGRAEVELS